MASLKVAVRVRPFNQRELDMNAKLIIQMDDKKTSIVDSKTLGVRRSQGGNDADRFIDYTFDFSYWSHNELDSHFASQEQVYSDLGVDVVNSAFQGYNACVFAYGQTGSGKTFTMMGSQDSPGLIPRICKDLFNRMSSGKEKGANYRTEVSYLEIYKEKVKDLLRIGSGDNLKVREHPKSGPYVEELSKHLVSDYADIQECMIQGNSQRTTKRTGMNDESSRSHAIFTITFIQAGFSKDMPSETVSKVHLVDLAGSERQKSTGATGNTLKEGAHINKSLVTLGSVISALAEIQSTDMNKSRTNHIPYRDSVLTWLLKDSLGGNSKTIMIAAISPADCNLWETRSTLRYANRAKNIINKPKINEDPNVKLIRELREEIRMLKESSSYNKPEPKVLAALHEKEAREKVLTEEWTEKWRETQQILQEQRVLGLRKSGVGVVLDSENPHLVGISDDLLSTGVTLYHLKEGETNIGSAEASSQQDIVLSGCEILPEHCTIVLLDGVATIYPKPNAQCLLGNVMIEKPTRLNQGCFLQLGRNVFRYNDPAEAAKLRQVGSKSHLNLSRLSLLSWSTNDLATSTENLAGGDPELEAQRAELLKQKQSFLREQAERERDFSIKQQKKERDLENAQKQLELDREEMRKEIEIKRQKIKEDSERLEKSEQDNLALFLHREKQIKSSRELLKQEREAALAEVENISATLETLQASLVTKRRLLKEFVLSNLQKLKETGEEVEIYISRCVDSDLDSPQTLDECTEILLKLSKEANIRSKISEHRNQLSSIKSDIASETAALSANQARLESIDNQLSNLTTKQYELQILGAAGDSQELLELRQAIASRPQYEIDLIQQRKMSLSLNIKRPLTKVGECSRSNDLLENLDLPIALNNTTSPLRTNDTFHTANSDCSVGNLDTSNVEIIDKIMADSGVGLDKPVSEHSTSSSSTPNKMKVAVTVVDNHDMDLKVSENGTSSTSSFERISLDNSLDSKLNNNSSNNTIKQNDNHVDDSNKLDQKEKDCLIESLEQNRPPFNTPSEQINTHEFEDPLVNPPRTGSLKIMQRLQQRVSRQKMLIMRNLEGHCPKSQLDHQISVLQDLQKQYVQLEKYLQQSISSHGYGDSIIVITPDHTSSDDDSISTRDARSIRSHADPTIDIAIDPIQNDGSVLSPLQFTSAYLTSQGENCTSPYSLSLTRSLPSFAGFDDEGHCVSITGYVVRGAGKQTHIEYEVRVRTEGENWSLLRRYSRFRELHITMKSRYGARVGAITFPPRQLFSSSSESIARTRRRLLEIYLRRLIQVCCNIKSCPLNSCADNVNKLCLLEFSEFFKKGMFESTKYGTS